PTVIGLLENFGLEPEAVRKAVLAPHGPGTSKATGEWPYTSLAKKSLERAMTEARNQKSEGVGSDAVLIGVLEAARHVADTLAPMGLTPTTLRLRPVRPSARGEERQVW